MLQELMKKKRSGLTTNPDTLIKAVCETAMGKRNLLTINGNDYDTKDGTTIRETSYMLMI